jgi:hypothetical protein
MRQQIAMKTETIVVKGKGRLPVDVVVEDTP